MKNSHYSNNSCKHVLVYLALAFAALHLRNPLYKHEMGSIAQLSTNYAVEKKSQLSQNWNPGLLGEKRERYLCAMPPCSCNVVKNYPYFFENVNLREVFVISNLLINLRS